MEFLNDQLRTVDYESAPWILACGVLSPDALQTPKKHYVLNKPRARGYKEET